jgi:hypothetical protein
MEGRFGTVLVDGSIGATWKIIRDRGRATLQVEPVLPLGRRDMNAVAAEGERLIAFTDPDAERTVSVTHVTKSSARAGRIRGRAGDTLERVTKKEK